MSGSGTALVVAVLVAVGVAVWPGRPRRAPGLRPVRASGPGSVRRWFSTLRARRSPAAGEPVGLLAFLDVVAPSLRAGRTPEEAARLACEVVEDDPTVTTIRDGIAAGRSLDSILESLARDDPDARLVARAWRLSTTTGCPLAAAVECSARLVRARVAHRRRIETSSAGARTTIRVLTLLPLGGPLLALAVGVDPVTAYVTSPTAWACLALGATLTLAGRAWVDRLVRAVARGPVLAPEVRS